MSSLTSLSNELAVRVVGQELKETVAESGIQIASDDKTPSEQHDLKKILIPREMNKLQGSFNLLKEFKEEETLRNYNRSYAGFFMNDFFVVIKKAIDETFGMLTVSRYDTNGNPAATDYIQIPVGLDKKGHKKTEQGYVGSLKAPCWEDAIVDIDVNSIRIRAKLKFEKEVNQFLEGIEQVLKSHSIVKTQAVTITQLRSGVMANFINPIINDKIVLNAKVDRVVNNLIIPSLDDTGKQSILFTGDYGTGKTETAIKVGVSGAVSFGKTFFYLHDAAQLPMLIPFIKNYNFCTVFVEDVDQVTSGDRDQVMNNILNQIEGQELKNLDVTFIFTTNNHDKIHPAMRRPGRIDQIVHFDYCDVDMVERIYKIFADTMKGGDKVDCRQAAEGTPEKLQGAVVAEIAKRAMRYAEKMDGGKITTGRFLDAIASMEYHIKFMKDEQNKEKSTEEMLTQIVGSSIEKYFPDMAQFKG